MTSTENEAALPPAGLFRRFAAMVYDAFLIFAMLMLVAAPLVIWNGGPITHDGTLWGELKSTAFFAYLLGWIFLFYGWCWTRGGQTLGMSAWKIRVTGEQDQALIWRQVLIRLASAGLGLINFSALLYKDRRGWHERLSGTRTVHIPASRKP